MHALLLLCALTAVAAVLVVGAYLLLSGLPGIREIGLKNFLLGRTWDAEAGRFGILPLLLASLYGAGGAVVLGVPVGVLTALFLTRAAPPWLARPVETAVGVLAGVPSVVVGLVGMCALVPWLRRRLDLPAGDTLLAAVLVLAVMLLPPVISLASSALRAVPAAWEEASLALGATETETWLRVTLPGARRGIAAAVVLGAGRALGEATAVMMVAGNVANMPSLRAAARLLTTGVALEMGYAVPGSLHRRALYSIGLVLFVLVMLVNALLALAGRERDGERT